MDAVGKYLTVPKTIWLRGSSPRSAVAEAVGEFGRLAYRFSLVLAAVALLIATAFALAISEPMSQRLLSVLFLGILPAVVAWIIGLISFWVLQLVGSIYDPIASASSSISQLLIRHIRRRVLPAP
jgi:uncharacterized integral membrane protein